MTPRQPRGRVRRGHGPRERFRLRFAVTRTVPGLALLGRGGAQAAGRADACGAGGRRQRRSAGGGATPLNTNAVNS